MIYLSGTAPLNYQWRKSGAAVSGATSSSLAFTASAVSDAGDYGVVITNSCGSVTSSAATLTVNKSTPALSVTSTQNPSGYLTALIFSTTAGGGGTTPTGTVQFRTNGAVFGSAATLTAGATSGGSAAHLPRGTNTIAAEYSGDSNYLPATNTLAQVVTNHPPGASAASFARGLTPFQIPTSALAGHWSDVDGDTVSIEGFDLTSTNGVVCSTNSTTLFYANASPVNDRLNYTVRDSYGDVSPGVILFTMQPNTVGRGISLNFSYTVTTVQFSAVPGWTYGVQRSTNLASWLLIDTLTAPTNGLFEVLDDYSDTGFAPSSGFYRLIVP